MELVAERQASGVEVLNRAFTILEAFTAGSGGAGGALPLAEIARRSGLPKPTVHRLLQSLVQLGMVERSGERYQLGLRLFELGQAVPTHADLREAALPFLEDLYEATHEMVHFAVLDDMEVVYLERLRGHREQTKVASRVGGRQPAYCTGVGKALLAFNPETAVRLISGPPLKPRTPYTIVMPALLAKELERVRKGGVAFDRDENAIGVHCAAAPVIIDGHAVAAISVTGSPTRLDVERVAPAVKTAALGLARKLRAAGVG